METDADLVYRTLEGDQDAFGLLVKAYSEEVYTIALSIVGDPMDAEDLSQEAFIKAYLNLSQIKHPERFGGWLRKEPPSDPVGKLEVLASEGEAKFVGRFNSHFLLDAFRAMTGDAVRMRYRMESYMKATLHPLLLEDGTDNVHMLMPMRVY